MKKKMKKIVSILCMMSLLFSMLTVKVNASNDDIKVLVDGTELTFDVPPQIIDDYTMVPMRGIFEALGYDVEWRGDSSITAINKTDDRFISLIIDNSFMTACAYSYFMEHGGDMKYMADHIMDYMITLEKAPIIIDDYTFVPVRAISEASGCVVQWNNANRTVEIYKNTFPDVLQNNTEKGNSQEDSIPTGEPIESYDDKLSVGEDFVALIKDDNTLWMWGHNDRHQILENNEQRISKPTKILENVKYVSCGEYHTAVLKEDGSLWMFGDNTYGQLGNGNNEKIATPQHVLDNIVKVKCGNQHTVAMDKMGNVYVWGNNKNGQLGVSNKTKENSNIPIKIINDSARDIEAYDNYTILIDNKNCMYKAGNLSDPTYKDTPINIDIDKNDISFYKIGKEVTKVNCFKHMVSYNEKNNELKYYPKNTYNTYNTPNDVILSYANDNGIFYIKDKNSLYLKGTDLPGDNRKNKKTELHILDNVTDVKVSDSGFVIAILSDGSLWAWGKNAYSTLGNDDTHATYVPIKVIDNILSYKPVKKDSDKGLPHKIEILGDRSYENSYSMSLKFYDENGNLITPIGAMNVSVTNDSGNVVIQNQPLYIYDYMYDENGVLDFEILNRYIGKSVEDCGTANLQFTSAFYDFKADVKLSNMPVNTSSNSNSGNNSNSNSNNNLYNYYNNIVKELETKLENIKKERDTQIIVGDRTVMTYDHEKAARVEKQIEYYKALRDSCK